MRERSIAPCKLNLGTR